MTLAAVALFLAAELTARAIEPFAPTTEGWPSAQMAAKVDQMTDLAAGSTDVDVVFLGSSSMDQALNPLTFNSEGNGVTAYNASINAMFMSSLELWAIEVVLPTLDPEVVVIGLTTRELNDGGPQQHFDQLAESRGLIEFTTERPALISKVEDHLALLRIREALRTPYSLASNIIRRDRGERLLTGPFGQKIPVERDFSYEFSDAWRENWITKEMRDFAMGDVQFEALERLVAEIRNQGRSVVLLPLPVSSDYDAVQPGGATSLSEFQTLLSSVAGPGVAIIEPEIQFQSQDFRDPAHLNPIAAVEFTNVLLRDLAVLAEHDFQLAATHRWLASFAPARAK
ncbi:MAG: hypothetical protein WD651_12355 [Acidimicrobiia bacterium]